MSFPFLTSNAFFWWLAAIAIPIVIHLLNRRRHRVVRWAAMDFLLKATQESKGKKRLKHFIILTCRALAIAMLVLAVARPLLSNGLFSWGSSKVDTVILVLDRSASMELDSADSALSKRQKVINLTQDALANLGNAKLVLLDSATGQPLQIASPSTLHSIAQTQATDTISNIPALLSAAVDYILESNTGRTEIWLASDMQLQDWQNNSSQWATIRAGLGNLSEQTSLRVITLRDQPTNNLSVSIQKAQRVGGELLLEISVTQTGKTQTSQTSVTLSHNGIQSEEIIELAGQTTIHNKRLSLSDKSGFGYLQLPSDQNTRDNTSYFSYSTELPVHSAVVSETSESAFYLGLASAPPGYANQQSKRYASTDQIPFEELSHISWLAALPEGEQQEKLLRFIENGGTVAFYPPTSNNVTNSASILNTKWGLLNKAATGKFFIIEDWSRNDGPLRDGEDGVSIPVTKLKAIQSREISTPHTSLASWTNGNPFMVRAIHGKGAAYFISTLPDYTWSNLADADVILPTVQRLVLQGNERFGSGFLATVGKLPASLEVDSASMQRMDSATAHDSLNQNFQAGIYRIGERTIALNRPAEEDSPEDLSNEQLDQLLADTEYNLFEDDRASSSKSSQQLWQPLLILMLLFLITEAVLCLNKKRANNEPSL